MSENKTTNGDFIHGVKGLAEFLGCSLPTARKVAKDVPCYRHGHLIRFIKTDVLSALSSNNQ